MWGEYLKGVALKNITTNVNATMKIGDERSKL